MRERFEVFAIVRSAITWVSVPRLGLLGGFGRDEEEEESLCGSLLIAPTEDCPPYLVLATTRSMHTVWIIL